RQVLRHLQAGRTAGQWRAGAVCPEVTEAVDWLRSVAALLVKPTERTLSATGSSVDQLVTAWLAGDSIHWPDGPAQPPWDFPPPAFALVDYDFARVVTGAQPALETTDWPARLPESDWLHQPQWVRLARAGSSSGAGSSRCLVLLTAEEWPAELLQQLRVGHARVVTAQAAGTFAELGPDRYRVDPTDHESLARLLTAVAEPVDWLHGLPLAVTGPVDETSLDKAQWACLDSTAALLRASVETGVPMPRLWLLSQQAQPVHGAVGRPELGLLAGPVEVIGQEHPVRVRWLDLPGPDPAGWLAPLSTLLGADPAGDRTSDRLALRDGYWWRQTLLPVPDLSDSMVDLATGPAVHLVLGGTGGIGSTVAGWLLARSDCQLILLSRQPELPSTLAGWADRIRLLPVDLATEPIERVMAAIGKLAGRLDGVVHAIGQSTGSLIVRRTGDPAGTAKLRGALLMERLLAHYQPTFALYCSSMSAQFGGAGQFDYAAGNGLLDGFARYRAGGTLRLGIDWDVWREVGMARHALPGNPRHQAHLATGLTVAEAGRLLDRAWRLGLPQLLVSTTDLARSTAFYQPVRTATESTDDPADALAGSLRRWLGLTELDPAASLYELGADSLTLLDLVAEVHERFGVELSLSRFSHRVSLAEVLDQLAEHGTPAPAVIKPSRADAGPVPVQVWQTGTGPSVLCLLHPVGGDIQAYRSLAAGLDPRLTVCLIADPGLQQDRPSSWSLADRVERYYAALHSRFPIAEWQWRLAGWSFGGWLAVGLAAAAEAAGQPAEAVYLIDPPAPDAGPALADYQAEQLESVFAHELAQDGPLDRIGASARAYAERLARCCRVNLASMAEYSVPALAGTPSRLWLAGQPVPGLPAPAAVESQVRQWQARLAGLAGWQALDTTHYGIVRPPYARLIAEAISTSPLPVLATR
ncbi:MAG TPA: KR domain-containing protein, partial [Jatrophihabitans sp.]|nr:KR domain-containing protein [Jatrophihabitans sp.]